MILGAGISGRFDKTGATTVSTSVFFTS